MERSKKNPYEKISSDVAVLKRELDLIGNKLKENLFKRFFGPLFYFLIPCILFLFILVRFLGAPEVIFDSSGIPQELKELGFDQEEIKNQIGNEVFQLIRNGANGHNSLEVGKDSRLDLGTIALPEIELESVHLPLKEIYEAIKKIWGIKDVHVSFEIIKTKEDYQAELTVQKDSMNPVESQLIDVQNPLDGTTDVNYLCDQMAYSIAENLSTYSMIKIYYDQRDFDKVKSLANKLCKSELPLDRAEAYLTIGILYLDDGDNYHAEEFLLKAIEITQSNHLKFATPFIDYCAFLTKLNRYDEAYKEIKKDKAEVSSKDYDYYYDILGVIEMNHPNRKSNKISLFNSAERDFKKSLKVDGNFLDANEHLGILYLIEHRYKDAFPYLDLINRISNHNKIYKYELAYDYLKTFDDRDYDVLINDIINDENKVASEKVMEIKEFINESNFDKAKEVFADLYDGDGNQNNLGALADYLEINTWYKNQLSECLKQKSKEKFEDLIETYMQDKEALSSYKIYEYFAKHWSDYFTLIKGTDYLYRFDGPHSPFVNVFLLHKIEIYLVKIGDKEMADKYLLLERKIILENQPKKASVKSTNQRTEKNT